MSLPRLIVGTRHCRVLAVGNINSDATGFDMNREDANRAQEERHFLLDLPSRPLRLRGLIMPMLITVSQNAPQ